MSGIKNIKPIINLFVSKPGTNYITKPEIFSLPKADLVNLRPAIDTFERKTKSVTIDDVKKLFPIGTLDVNNYIVREMQKVLSRIEPPPKKIIDLSPILTEQDYKLIMDLMNLSNGKYIDVWHGFSDTDLIPNIEKLALFNRSIRLSKQAKDFLQFNQGQWDIVVNGIVKKPKESIIPLLEYKVNSGEINKALSEGVLNPEIQKKVDVITDYLNLFKTKKDIIVFRGEKSFGLFQNLKGPNGKKLDENLDLFMHVLSGLPDEEAIKLSNFYIDKNLKNKSIPQRRFMSTAMTSRAAMKYAKKVFWEIEVPAKTIGTSIESFNIEREAEAEFLAQRNSSLFIKSGRYEPKKKILYLKGRIEQSNIIDNRVNSVKIEEGVK